METKKILIVEDDEFLRKLILDELKSSGYQAIGAVDGEEGLKTAIKEKPDLILLDILMPKMDGMQMLGELRRDNWGKDAKVIMLTNLSDGEKIMEALESGAEEYLVKSSLNLDDITAKVKEKLTQEPMPK